MDPRLRGDDKIAYGDDKIGYWDDKIAYWDGSNQWPGFTQKNL